VQKAPAARSAGAPSNDGTQPPARADAKAAGSRGDADRIKHVVAEGNVRIQRGDRVAEGGRAVFDQAKQTIVLSDGAVLHEGPNKVAGDRIVVYLQEERSVVESGSNSRVSAVFYPGSGAPGGEAQ
jgi:lipopolysaccharide export system protein LptA